MPRYYCDYCDTYLTHDSPSVRKQHNAGYKHKANVRTYYQQFEEQQTQSLIDQRIKEHLGQAQAFGPLGVGAAYNQHLLGERPRLPLIPAPMPIPGTTQLPGNAPFPMRPPPMLPRPFPGYAPGPGMLPIPGPPGAPSYPGPGNGVLRPPTTIPGNMAPAPSSSAPTYQVNPAPPPSGGFDSFNANVPPPEANR